MDPRIIEKRRKRKENRKKRIKRRIRKFVLAVLLGLGIFLLLNGFVVTIVDVKGASMIPTYHDGDRLVVSKLEDDASDLHRFDVIVFKHVDGKNYVKRIIGLPGEVVEIKDDLVFINGEKLTSHYEMNLDHEVKKWIMADDEYFVLGDNRAINGSKDSRIFGGIKLKKIIGKCLFKI